METKTNSQNRLKKFISYYKPHKKVLFADLFCATIASITVLLYPPIIKSLTNSAISDAGIQFDFIGKITVLFIFLMAAEYVCNFYIAYCGHVMGAKMEFDMRNDLFNHFQKLSFHYYDNQKTGQLMSRITSDLFDVTELAHHGPEDIIISAVKIIGSFIILLNVNWMLTLILFSILPFLFIFCIYYNKKMKKAFKKNREKIANINSIVEDSLSGIRIVKSFTNEKHEKNKFYAGNSQFVDAKKNSYYYMGRFHSGLAFFISLMNVVIVLGATIFISKGLLQTVDLMTFLLYINLLFEPIKKLINFTEQFQSGATGFERFMEILEVEPDIVDTEDAIHIQNVKGKVEFKDVSFKYSEESDEILRNINITAAAGEYIALVGPSGAGKTSLLSLIPRFYETTAGSITLDDIDIKTIKLKSLRKNVGIVQQDVYLFAGTIRDNIAYGNTEATDEEIVLAAKSANAHEFISEMPEGYDTYIGQRGVMLSGGQKQKISIARVFLKNPAVLIFDEATSSLDNESEKIVQDSFEKLAKNRTTFVIAHRLSTIRNAQRILVLTERGIEEQGTHDELIKKGGVYSKLYNM